MPGPLQMNNPTERILLHKMNNDRQHRIYPIHSHTSQQRRQHKKEKKIIKTTKTLQTRTQQSLRTSIPHQKQQYTSNME